MRRQAIDNQSESIGERISFERSKLFMSRDAFMEITGLKKNRLYTIERGLTSATISELTLFSKHFKFKCITEFLLPVSKKEKKEHSIKKNKRTIQKREAALRKRLIKKEMEKKIKAREKKLESAINSKTIKIEDILDDLSIKSTHIKRRNAVLNAAFCGRK